MKFRNQEIFKKIIIYFNDFVPKVYELDCEESEERIVQCMHFSIKFNLKSNLS